MLTPRLELPYLNSEEWQSPTQSTWLKVCVDFGVECSLHLHFATEPNLMSSEVNDNSFGLFLN